MHPYKYLHYFCGKLILVNLIIDRGNTISKISLYEKDEEILYQITENGLLALVTDLLKTYKIDQAIYSSVVSDNFDVTHYLKENIPFFIELDEKTSLPIKVAYKTPKTLGKDRLAGVIGANYLQRGKNILVIDAGTAITYDLIDFEGIYWGGNISPGLQMRFKAMNHYTSKLPLLTPEGDIPAMGYSTETAIRSGVVNGLIYEIDGYINDFNKKYANLFIFLTGGDAFFLAAKLKNSIFADTKLLIKGLNRILNYNADL